MRSLVSDENIATYQRDGVVCLRQVLSAEWLSLLAKAIEENCAHPSSRAKCTGVGSGQFYNDDNAWRSSELFRQFLRTSPLAEDGGRASALGTGLSIRGSHTDQIAGKFDQN